MSGMAPCWKRRAEWGERMIVTGAGDSYGEEGKGETKPAPSRHGLGATQYNTLQVSLLKGAAGQGGGGK
jgi:hypothetical protein